MYFLIENDPNMRYDNIQDVIDNCVSDEYFENDSESFDEYLDQDGSIDVIGYDLYPSNILREMNYDAYMRELRSWAEDRAENEREEAEYRLERARNGDSVWICSYEVYCYEDEEKEEEEEEKPNLDLLEAKLLKQKEAEALVNIEQEKTANDFLSALGVQVI